MSIRTVCVADEATHEQLRSLVEHLPQCDVLAWVKPAEVTSVVGAMLPELIITVPSVAHAVHEQPSRYAPRSRYGVVEHDVVALAMTDGVHLHPAANVIRIKGEGSYVRIVFSNRSDIILAKTMADCERIFPQGYFVRVHRSNIVNIRHIKRLIRGKLPMLHMSNNDVVVVSERYREPLLQCLPEAVRPRQS